MAWNCRVAVFTGTGMHNGRRRSAGLSRLQGRVAVEEVAPQMRTEERTGCCVGIGGDV
jgi:hypothetical protein